MAQQLEIRTVWFGILDLEFKHRGLTRFVGCDRTPLAEPIS
jgi:hypothetical protein